MNYSFFLTRSISSLFVIGSLLIIMLMKDVTNNNFSDNSINLKQNLIQLNKEKCEHDMQGSNNHRITTSRGRIIKRLLIFILFVEPITVSHSRSSSELLFPKIQCFGSGFRVCSHNRSVNFQISSSILVRYEDCIIILYQ